LDFYNDSSIKQQSVYRHSDILYWNGDKQSLKCIEVKRILQLDTHFKLTNGYI
jgi:hypothetical protein